MVTDSNKRLWTTLNCNYDCTVITRLARRGRSSICRAVRKPAARQTQPGLPLRRAVRRRTGGVVAAVAAHPLPPGGRCRPAHRHYRHPHRPGRDLCGNGCRCRAGLHRTYLPPEPSGSPHDRYTKAVEQLGSDKIEVRLGGIYALERLMRDSSTDQPTIVEVLAAYIRQHAPPASLDEAKTADSPTLPSSPDADVQAALTVLGRRAAVAAENHIDLTGAHLAGAQLGWADLTGANLH